MGLKDSGWESIWCPSENSGVDIYFTSLSQNQPKTTTTKTKKWKNRRGIFFQCELCHKLFITSATKSEAYLPSSVKSIGTNVETDEDTWTSSDNLHEPTWNWENAWTAMAEPHWSLRYQMLSGTPTAKEMTDVDRDAEIVNQNGRHFPHYYPFPHYPPTKGCESESRSVMPNSLRPHRLCGPWNSSGQNTGVGSFSLLQGMFPTQGSNPSVPHYRRTLYQLSHKGSPRILEWVAYPFSSRSSWPRSLTGVSCTAGGFFITDLWASLLAQLVKTPPVMQET